MSKNTLKTISKENLAELFSKGQYKVLVETYNRDPQKISIDALHFVIGALSFLGHNVEAEELYRTRALPPASSAAALFYLGVGITRKSKYKTARKFFKLNQELHARSEDPAISFYSYQGIAFYLFYTGQFYRCEKYATKAFRLAVQAGLPQIKILAQDLLAHTLVKTGKISAGLQMFREAHKLSVSQENTAFTTAIEVSILLVEAEYGYRTSEIIADLEKCLKEIDPQDNYSQSNVALELARQKLLRGQWRDSQSLLNTQASVIFAGGNRRQEIILNLRWAKVAFLQGQNVLAWQYLRSAQLRVHDEADQHFMIQILSMEIEILEEHHSPDLAAKKAQLLSLQETFASGIHRNQLSRLNLIPDSQAPQEDLIHEALQRMKLFPQESLQIVENLGYYSWLYKCLPLKRGQDYLVSGIKKDSIALVTQEGITLGKVSGVAAKILQLLQKGPVSKAELVEYVWGYQYHPLRHDNLIYTAMSSLRKSFSVHHDWIQTLDDGYRLREGLMFYGVGKPPKSPAITGSEGRSHKAPTDTDLNFRQIQALEYLQENRFLNTRIYKDLFQTTEITASRDLASLNKKGLVIRLGHGRAIQYTLSGKAHS